VLKTIAIRTTAPTTYSTTSRSSKRRHRNPTPRFVALTNRWNERRTTAECPQSAFPDSTYLPRQKN